MLVRTALGQPLLVALLLMVASVLGYSSLPVFVFRAGGFDSPFLFNFLWRVFMLSGVLVLLLVFHRGLLLSPSCWREVRRRLWDWRILVLSVSYLDLGAYSLAMRLVDPRSLVAGGSRPPP